MLSVALVAGWLALVPGLGLAPGEEPVAPIAEPAPAPPAPGAAGAPAAVLTALAAAAAALVASRAAGAALGLRPPDDALVVFVPGHGQGSGAFRRFIELMGLDPGAVRHFDYRWVTGDADPGRASSYAPLHPTAASLNSYLGGVAVEDRPVWLVGFSKGGAVVAELLAAWDRGLHRPDVDVRGAMLLDPPIASGVHGALQSAGRLIGPIPDDGGYDPVHCSFLAWGCRDSRVDLGRASGVEVLVVRNPRAGVTSFFDRPDGLRVLDAPDAGPGPWGQLLRNPFRIFGRISEAHESVLSDPAVARCLVREMWRPGSCRLQTAPGPVEFRPLRVRARSPLARAV